MGAAYAHYQPFGVNAGVLLLNLTRMRSSGFVAFALNYTKYSRLGDQDILNEWLESRREQAYILPCELNRRTDSRCDAPMHAEPAVLHGNRAAFEHAKIFDGCDARCAREGSLFRLAADVYHLSSHRNISRDWHTLASLPPSPNPPPGEQRGAGSRRTAKRTTLTTAGWVAVVVGSTLGLAPVLGYLAPRRWVTSQ